MADLTIHFDFNNLTVAFTASLSRILERAAFSLHAVESASVSPSQLPNIAGPVPSPQFRPRPIDDIRSEVRGRLVRDAMRECVEELSRFLEHTRRTCAAVALSVRGAVTAKEWAEAVEEPAARFDRLTLPDKITRLRTDYGPDIVHELIDQISTLNVLRNCLVHGHGVVRRRDCNVNDTLVARWKYMKIMARAPDGQERDVELNMMLEAGTQLIARHVEAERAFALNDRVELSETDLAGIFFTFHFFGAGTAQRVVDFARSHGFTIGTPNSTGEMPPARPGSGST